MRFALILAACVCTFCVASESFAQCSGSACRVAGVAKAPARVVVRVRQHPRYGDHYRNLPSWEWQMIEDGASNAKIEAEWDRRYGTRRICSGGWYPGKLLGR